MKDHNKIIEKHLKDEFNLTVNIDSEWECVVLSHEEVDTQLIPQEELNKRPNPAMFHMVSKLDEEENEWLFTLAVKPNQPEKLSYALSILNGERIASWVDKDK